MSTETGTGRIGETEKETAARDERMTASKHGAALRPQPSAKSELARRFATPGYALRRARASRARARRAGFSLLEVLSAMTILVIIVMMMGIIFTESERSWTNGTNRVENNAAGRAALGLLVHDLQYAVADEFLTFTVGVDRFSVESYGFTNAEACFVSLQGNSAGGERTAREIFYYVRERTNATGSGARRYELVRGYYSDALSSTEDSTYARHCYSNRGWFAQKSAGGAGRPAGFTVGVVAENVAGFGFYHTNGLRNYESWTQGDRVPSYLDICLELLNERPAVQAAQLMSCNLSDKAMEHVERNLKRYTTRVYFHNRDGYKIR